MLGKMRISAYKFAIEGGTCRYVNSRKHKRIRTACYSGEVE